MERRPRPLGTGARRRRRHRGHGGRIGAPPERARKRAVYTDELVMMDALDGSEVAHIPVGEAFRRRTR